MAFWTYFETVNIITDFMLVLLPLGIIWGVQARKARKAIIFGCFAVRILYVGNIYHPIRADLFKSYGHCCDTDCLPAKSLLQTRLYLRGLASFSVRPYRGNH